MNKNLKTFAAILFSAAIIAPTLISAAQPKEIPASDTGIQTHVDDYQATQAFIELDDQALDELQQLGVVADDQLANDIIDYAERYLGRPYRHGAKGPKAFDCSGFTSYVFKNSGIDLSPSSRVQYTQGYSIPNDQIRPGDLLFFSGRRGGKTVGHVAIAVEVEDDGTVKFIHAATRSGIRYDKYPDGGYYSKRYIGARRVIE